MADHTLAVWLALPISDVVCQLATLPPIFLHLKFLSRVRSRRAMFWYNTRETEA